MSTDIYNIKIECAHSLEETCQLIASLEGNDFFSRWRTVKFEPLPDGRRKFIIKKIRNRNTTIIEGFLESQSDESTLVQARSVNGPGNVLVIFILGAVFLCFLSNLLSPDSDFNQASASDQLQACCVGYFITTGLIASFMLSNNTQSEIENDLRRVLAR